LNRPLLGNCSNASGSLEPEAAAINPSSASPKRKTGFLIDRLLAPPASSKVRFRLNHNRRGGSVPALGLIKVHFRAKPGAEPSLDALVDAATGR